VVAAQAQKVASSEKPAGTREAAQSIGWDSVTNLSENDVDEEGRLNVLFISLWKGTWVTQSKHHLTSIAPGWLDILP
jgi:hypothetical protein